MPSRCFSIFFLNAHSLNFDPPPTFLLLLLLLLLLLRSQSIYKHERMYNLGQGPVTGSLHEQDILKISLLKSFSMDSSIVYGIELEVGTKIAQ